MNLNNLKSIFKTPEIEFLCLEEDWQVIPPPIPAKKFIPDWYKALPMKLGDKGLTSSTIKRCNPFLDALSLGWIIPSAADVSFTSNEDCSRITYRWNFNKTMIEEHNPAQITSPKSPNPLMPKRPLKYMNYWFIKPSPGYSVLFVPPLNRVDPRLTFFSGFVDSDKYFERVNFPFVFSEPNFSGIIPAGTPLVQAIPIQRSSIIKENTIRPATPAEVKENELLRRKRASHESVYRDSLVEKK